MPRNSKFRAYQQAMRDMAQEYGKDNLCELEYKGNYPLFG